MTGAAATPICPCGTVALPTVVFNPPGRSTLAYRWGDYISFRYALLQALLDEAALSQIVDGKLQQIWRPTGEGDLALQLIEWTAYLADILTFYCERGAIQAFLDTADQPESVNRLIHLLGYRPRPAIGATGTVAVLLSGNKPVTLPQGFQIQSKPGPGQQPQIFELIATTKIGPPDQLALTAASPVAPVLNGGTNAQGQPLASLLLSGTVGGLKAGEEVLLTAQGWAGTDGNWGVGMIQQFAPQKDPAGANNTAVTIAVTGVGSALDGGKATGYRLMKTGGTATLFQYADSSIYSTILGQSIGRRGAPGASHAVLASVFRQIAVGDMIVLEDPSPNGTNPPLAAVVTAYTEKVYYANNPLDPTTAPSAPGSPPSAQPIGIPLLVSVITFATPGAVFGNPTTVVVRYGWKDLGTLIDPPVATVGGTAETSLTGLQLAASEGFAPAPGTPVQVVDANGNGAAATIDAPGSVTIAAPVPSLAAPLTALFDLLAVNRGKSVVGEVLGSGNAAILGQDFTLKNAPVTYLQDPGSKSGDDYSSTVRVSVNGVEWQEVRSFFGQPEAAQIFMTREDEQGNTHVVFSGRLPTGVNNIVANYRYGAGAAVPAPGALSVVLQPQPGLKAIVNPVAPGGGADPDPPGKIKRLAPLSVMSFDRAVSLEDYQVIAETAPGVARATAAYVFDSRSQRPGITVWVGDDEAAVASASRALAAAADPNRPPTVTLATQQTMLLSLAYVRHARYLDANVRAGLTAALIDPDNGLFGANVVAIGEAFFDSQIYATCLAVPGVVAIHNLSFAPSAPRFRPLILFRPSPGVNLIRGPIRTAPCTGERYDPGAGAYFAVLAANLKLSGTMAP
jgi:hypothetical protein